MTVGMSKRFIGSLINIIVNVTIIGGIINLIFIVTKGQTVGGMVIGYKYNERGIILLFKIWAGIIITNIMWGFTLFILFFVELFGLARKNDGWLWEKIMGIKKVNA